MKKVYLLILTLLLAACSASTGETKELTVTNVRANMTLPSDTGSVWMQIHNGTDKDDALTGAEFEGCGAIELHDMKMENNVMIMRPVENGQISIPAGGMVELKQGGLHVMCIGKAAPLEVGSTLNITLHFANAGAIDVVATVVEPGGAMDMESGDHSNMNMDSN